MQDLNKFKNEMNLSGQNVYVGHRYVPKIMGDWDNTQIYEPLSIVQYQGNSFTSRQFVPSGIEITNEEFWASTGNYNAQVEQYRQDVVNLGNDIANFNDDIVEITNSQDSNVKMLDSLGVYVVNFGVKANDASIDNHDAIIDALNYAKTNNIATIIFPAGEIYTSPISLQGYQYLKFKGQSSYNYADYGTPVSHNETSLRFISYAEYGVQTAGLDWNARGISFVDITLNGDYKVDNIINGRYNTTFENFVARGGNKNGIVLEDTTYPVKLVNTHANFNKENGLYIKSPFTTVYHVTNSEFSRNDGYGILIEGFAGSDFNNVTVQDNKRGGVKINSPEDTSFTNPYWLQTLQFDTLYTEANGQLEETDVNYEGNYGIIITGVGTVRPRKVHFINSTINKHAKGRNIKVDYGEDIYFDLNTYVGVDIDVNKDTSRVSNVHFSKVTNTWQRPTITHYGEGTGLNVIPTIYKPEKTNGLQITGAFIGSRGRTTIYEFYNKDIEPNTPTEMNTFSGSGVSYHCHDTGSILGVHLTAKNRSGINGKFNISIEKRKLNNGTWAVMTNDSGTQMVYSWNTATASDMLQRYLTFNDFKFDREDEIRIVITSEGHVAREDNNFTVTLIVEY